KASRAWPKRLTANRSQSRTVWSSTGLSVSPLAGSILRPVLILWGVARSARLHRRTHSLTHGRGTAPLGRRPPALEEAPIAQEVGKAPAVGLLECGQSRQAHPANLEAHEL